MLSILGRILRLRARQPLSHLTGKLGLSLDHAGMAHRLMFGDYVVDKHGQVG
jgi:hypothetical protein